MMKNKKKHHRETSLETVWNRHQHKQQQQSKAEAKPAQQLNLINSHPFFFSYLNNVSVFFDDE
jgi:hypothetical protein